MQGDGIMEVFYYYRTIRKSVIQFLDMFSSINVLKYNSDGSPNKYIKTPIKLAGKEKTWYWINEARKNSEYRLYEMLPLIAAEITGIEYVTDRQKNIKYDVTGSNYASGGVMTARVFANPSPWNIHITLRIYSLYMAEVDQILEQILPYFTPYAQMKIKIEDVGEAFDAKVIFNSASPEQSYEYGDEERRNIVWSLDFTIHTLFFKPTSDVGIIEKIILKYYANEDAWNDYQGTETMYTSGASGANTHEAESQFIKGVSPWIDADGDKVWEMEHFRNNEDI